MEIIDVEISKLIPSEYNPRLLTEKAKVQIWESILQFGMVEPIVVNNAKGRENIIIGGHQRWYICKEMGKKTMPVVYVTIDDLEREKELNLRLNRNLGEWNWDELANFDEDLLKMVGFDNDDIAKLKGLEIDDLIEMQDVDISRFDVIVVDGPSSPKLKNRKGFYFEDIEQFNQVVNFFKTNIDYKLDGGKLLEFLKK